MQAHMTYEALNKALELAATASVTCIISVTQPLLEDWSPTLAGGLRPQSRD
jgi:hypothetical protein